MRDAAEMIVGPQEQLSVISVQLGDGGNDVLEGLTTAIKEVDSGEGVLLLTDLFGGTPTNIGCALLGEAGAAGAAGIEVVTGFNLPLLIKALTSRPDVMSLSELALTASEYGRRHISVAGDLLQGGAEENRGTHE
jgi:PTS system mannose-specific IIA component